MAALKQDDEWVDLLEMTTLCEAFGRLRKKTQACKRKHHGWRSWPGFQGKWNSDLDTEMRGRTFS